MLAPSPWPIYSDVARARVDDLVRSGAVFDYAGAGAVAELEDLLRARYATQHAVTFDSGTSAIFAGLAALGVQPGDEVVVAGWTFLAAMTPLLWLGAIPVLADTAPGQPVATVETVVPHLTPRTRAVVVTHLFGEAVDTARLRQALAPTGVAILEDCSHAHASVVDGRPPGASADVAVLSLGARKIVSGGHGGVLLTRDHETYETALMIGHSKPRTRAAFAGTPLAAHAELALGGNLRMSPIAAALATDHLVRLDELSRARVENHRVLTDALGPQLAPLRSTAPGENRTHFDLVWTIVDDSRAERRDALVAALVAAGVPAKASSTRPLSRALRAVAARPTDHPGRYWTALDEWAVSQPLLPEAEATHDRTLSLPSELFYEPDTRYAAGLAKAITSSVAEVLA